MKRVLINMATGIECLGFALATHSPSHFGEHLSTALVQPSLHLAGMTVSQSKKNVVFIKPQLMGKAMTWTIVVVEIAHVYASEVMINCLKLRVEVIEFMCRHIHW